MTETTASHDTASSGPGHEDGDAGTTSVLAPLRRPRLRRMVSAQFLAEVGDGISLVALPLYVWERTESEVWTSLTFAVELGLGILFSIVGGALADAFDRQRVLLVSYVVRGALLLGAFLVDPLLGAVALGVSARALAMADNPSFDALIPDQAEGDLQQVVALRRMIQAVSITLGPGIGALAVWSIGARPSLLLNAVTFALAFVLLVSVRNLDPNAIRRQDERDGMTVGEATRDLVSGMAIALQTPGVRRLIAYFTLVMVVVGLLMASAIVFYERDLDAADYWYGLAISGWGIGNALGLGIAGSRPLPWTLPRIIVVASPIYAVACSIGGLVDQPWLLVISWLIWGLAMGPEFVRTETFFLSRIEERHRGRAFAGLGVASSLGMTIGSLAAAPLLSSFSARQVILGSGVAVMAMIFIWVGPARQGDAWPGTEPVDPSFAN